MIDLATLILEDMFWSALAALGFALLFNVPRKALIYCVIGGAVGHALRTVLIEEFDLAIEVATLVGSAFVGFWAKGWAYRLQMPSMIFAVSAVIPMVPGVFAYQTMIGLLRVTSVPHDEVLQILSEVTVNGVRTILILATIAVGIVSPTLLFWRDRPIA